VVSAGDLLLGALIPGLLLVTSYALYVAIVAYLNPNMAPALPGSLSTRGMALVLKVLKAVVPPVPLILQFWVASFGLATQMRRAAGAVGLLRSAGQVNGMT
jgi:TRAP-type mannitol/chloroaromatic compound transport system permease large subunit